MLHFKKKCVKRFPETIRGSVNQHGNFLHFLDISFKGKLRTKTCGNRPSERLVTTKYKHTL